MPPVNARVDATVGVGAGVVGAGAGVEGVGAGVVAVAVGVGDGVVGVGAGVDLVGVGVGVTTGAGVAAVATVNLVSTSLADAPDESVAVTMYS